MQDRDTILFQYLKSKEETSLPHPCVAHFLVVCHGGVIHVLMDHMRVSIISYRIISRGGGGGGGGGGNINCLLYLSQGKP